ncbi:capsular biosynthesis protein CpsI [Prochlorococcus marinus str. MU1404]|uniref:NAD-dependent epimerase n=1 Tax=Prochlorococcus marinus TaxID=1219 RepID=UPI001ADAB4E7|nr:NAD-dependent epimerase [Prochlorococcus marinus]MBO8230560.1 NAD-dependent epimerase [Prochlorococcus marinus XMU1404]MBW3073606.1 capsular biosynthesis protein CpsI [Prochlorococcus marinus str. MU1404]MCR8545107.1 NAD-dependent epimerase [Prochlorococcus marinus CUG1432]
MKILITGAAGFIGYHLTKKLLEKNNFCIGIDNFNSYYDPNLKHARFENLQRIAEENNNNFKMINGDIKDQITLDKVFQKNQPNVVVNLAAQAGVRYSLDNPSAYIQSNIVGFANLLEACRNFQVKHLVYASSSSVYGGNTNMPFTEKHGVDHPISLYAATKKANELMAHSYSHLYSIPATGLRFFTVYGPWGRPDMALFLFTKSILNREPIKVFNHGKMKRAFTYIDDIVESILKIIDKPPKSNKKFDTLNPNPANSWAPHKVFNIGNAKPVSLNDYISAIEDSLGIKAEKLLLPIQPGDVECTSSDCSALESWIDFKPNTPIKVGIKKFTKWYREFYGV